MFKTAMLACAFSAILMTPIAYAQNCAAFDQEQADINYSWRWLKSRYPVTTSFHASCMRDATTVEGSAACTMTAIGMAGQCPWGGCDTSSEEYGNVFGGLIVRYGTLKARRERSNCRLNIPDLFLE